MSDVYSYTVELPNRTLKLSDYKSKTLILVNVASFGPEANDQYPLLQALEEQSSGVQVIGFPCNEFGGFEPGTDQEILEYVQDTFQVTFPIAKKADVNDDDAMPLWKYLKAHAEDPVDNFTKFVVNDGKIKWFPTQSSIGELLEHVH